MTKDNWTYKNLGDLCKILDSQRKPVSKQDRKTGIYPYYGASGIQDYVDSYIFDGRYLLVGEDGAKWGSSDKSAFVVEGRCWVNNHAHILKVGSSVVDRFLEYYLVNEDLSKYITGAIVPKLTQKSLLNLSIPVPPLDIQARIVSELDNINNLINIKKSQLKDLDNLAQSIFYEMFGDPVENEKSWDVKRFREIFDVTSSKRFYQTELVNEGVPFLKVSDLVNLIENNSIEPSTFITNSAYDNLKMKGFVPSFGDLLVTARGTIGKCYIVKQDDRFYFQDGMVTWLKNEKKLANANYIKALMYFDSFKLYLAKNAKHTTVDYISIQQLAQMHLCLPPLSLQQKFAEKIEAIEKHKQIVNVTIKDLETLLASRMQFWFE